MSVTLSPPVRVAALLGALVLTGLAAVVFFLGRGIIGNEPAASVPVTKAAPRSAQAPGAAAPSRQAVPAKPRIASGLPAKLDRALRSNRVVVVSVSVPGAAVDRVVRREARAAARASHAGFVAVSSTNEKAIAALVAKAGVLPAPAVLIVKRPGVVASTFSVTDAGTIAQAVAQARR